MSGKRGVILLVDDNADDVELTLDDLDVEWVAAAPSFVDEAGVVVDAFATHTLCLSR